MNTDRESNMSNPYVSDPDLNPYIIIPDSNPYNCMNDLYDYIYIASIHVLAFICCPITCGSSLIIYDHPTTTMTRRQVWNYWRAKETKRPRDQITSFKL